MDKIRKIIREELNKIKNFDVFLNESNLFKNNNMDNIFAGNIVADYYKTLNSREDFEINLHDNLLSRDYTLESIRINDILKYDIDLKNFVNSEINDIDGMEHKRISLYEPIIIGMNAYTKLLSVVDGYHRITELVRQNNRYVDAYVPIM